jgi:hypothetical protein
MASGQPLRKEVFLMSDCSHYLALVKVTCLGSEFSLAHFAVMVG